MEGHIFIPFCDRFIDVSMCSSKNEGSLLDASMGPQVGAPADETRVVRNIENSAEPLR